MRQPAFMALAMKLTTVALFQHYPMTNHLLVQLETVYEVLSLCVQLIVLNANKSQYVFP